MLGLYRLLSQWQHNQTPVSYQQEQPINNTSRCLPLTLVSCIELSNAIHHQTQRSRALSSVSTTIIKSQSISFGITAPPMERSRLAWPHWRELLSSHFLRPSRNDHVQCARAGRYSKSALSCHSTLSQDRTQG